MPVVASAAVRSARPGDLDAVEALENACFGVADAQSRRSLRYLITRANADVWLAEAGQALLADIIVLYRHGTRVARIYSIAVGARARGQGLGQTLLATAEQAAKARGCRLMRAEARVSNTASLALFMSAGYRRGRHLPDYYADDEEGVRLQKPLDE